MKSPKQQLAEMILGQNIEEWVGAKRAEGRSWRLVSRDLYDQTNKRVDVTYETLRTWVKEHAA